LHTASNLPPGPPLNRLSNVGCLNFRFSGQIGNGAGQADGEKPIYLPLIFKGSK